MEVFLTAGIVLGLSAGFSPGPLTTLVISQALQYGVKEGLKVALTPFLSDLPIVCLSVFVLTRLRDSHSLLGFISIVGGSFLVFLAYLSFKTSKLDVDVERGEPRSLGKGTLVNLFSPNPYLFWMSVGAPYAVDAWTHSGLMAAGFFACFYMCLVGGKMFMAVVAGKSRRMLAGKAYGYVMSILGALLLVFAAFLFRDGLRFLDVWNP